MKKQFNRRQFLKSTSIATASAPLLWSSAWAAPGQKGPNDRIILGFIGTGTQGRGLLQGFLNHSDTQVVAVCDVDTTRREHHRKIVEEHYSIKQDTEFKGCAEYKEFADLIARPDIDAVVIAVPDHWHTLMPLTPCERRRTFTVKSP